MNRSHYDADTLVKIKRRRILQYGTLAIGSSIIPSIITACTGNSTSNSATTATSSAPNSPEPSPSFPSNSLTKMTFGTNWYAQAEHGGFYQAIATGIYKEHELDVAIRMGGPQVNGTQLLMAGAIDFYMGSSSLAIKAIAEKIPKITVAAIFQKDPQVLLVHPNTGVKDLADLKDRPIFISAEANTTFWPFLQARYGFTDAQKRPYNFNAGPFLADQTSAQQGYLSSEPLAIEKEGKFQPIVFLLADHGYTPYSTTIECKRELAQTQPELVQRFVDASIKGWYSYLEGDPTPGNELIKKDNPDMTDEKLQYGIAKMKEYGIVISGDAFQKGIGAMTDERWKSFFNTMASKGVFNPDTDYRQAYTLDFVNRGVNAYRKGS